MAWRMNETGAADKTDELIREPAKRPSGSPACKYKDRKVVLSK
jgi:hypothetical protein